MARTFESPELVIASHNPGKVREIGALLAPFGVIVKSASELNLPEPIEDGGTFIDNAVLKAQSATKHSGLPALADDSGLAVEALGGAPGIYSARWAGEDKDFDIAMARVNAELGDSRNDAAAFICVLALSWPDRHVEVFEGRVEGNITWPPRGDNGFGYDPIFTANGYDLTFGELDPNEKHRISHRADAFEKLVRACFTKR